MIRRRKMLDAEAESRIKHFIWRCLSNALPTNARRSAAVPSFNNVCVMCNNASESIEHLFLDCPFAREVWDLFPNLRRWLACDNFAAKISCWLSADMKEGNQLILTCWCLWKARCIRLFEGTAPNAANVYTRVLSLMSSQDFIDVNHHSMSSRTESSGTWSPYDSAIMTYNVDGAVRSEGSAWGIIGRNGDGKILSICSGGISSSDPALVEATGILNAIKIAGISGELTHIFSDASILISSILEHTSHPPWTTRHIINECRHLLQLYPLVSISFSRRCKNHAAHTVAANACSARTFDFFAFANVPETLLSNLCIPPTGICFS